MEYYVKSVVPIIESNYDKFTTVERNIADFFIQNRKKVDFSSKSISERLFVSEASLSRFAKKCGYRGYREFIYQYEETFVEKQESITGNTRMILNAYQELLNKTYSLVDEAQIARISRYLNQAERVFVCGTGSSGLAAREMELRFMRIGVDIDSLVERDMMRMQAVFQDRRSLVFGISISGSKEEVLFLLKEAYRKGAKTILFTANNRGDFEQFCTEVVLIPSLRHLNHGNVISPQFPILVMLDIIYSYYLEQDKYEKEIKEEKQKVLEAGGLKIIGTERHESRRIDNQLRGRSGRQGDPGESRFYIGLDDDLMKIFGGETITKLYDTLGADENMPIESKLISNSVESAQRRVEGRNFSIRKNVLNYDDVMNTQREIIYKQRREILDGEDLKGNVLGMIKSLIEDIATPYFADEHINKEGLLQELNANLTITELNSLQKPDVHLKEVIEEAVEKATAIYEERENEIGSEELRELERVVTLKVVDEKWMDHIDNMDELKDGIGLRAYGQKDPVVQYRIEGFDMFDKMVNDIKHDVVKILLNINRVNNVERKQTVKITSQGLEQAVNALKNSTPQESKEVSHIPVTNEGPKVGRNDPCPCRQPVKNIKIVVVNNVLKKGE